MQQVESKPPNLPLLALPSHPHWHPPSSVCGSSHLPPALYLLPQSTAPRGSPPHTPSASLHACIVQPKLHNLALKTPRSGPCGSPCPQVSSLPLSVQPHQPASCCYPPSVGLSCCFVLPIDFASAALPGRNHPTIWFCSDYTLSERLFLTIFLPLQYVHSFITAHA